MCKACPWKMGRLRNLDLWATCVQALLQQAGTHSSSGQVDPLCWDNFRTWFTRGLKTLHQVRRDVTYFCS